MCCLRNFKVKVLASWYIFSALICWILAALEWQLVYTNMLVFELCLLINGFLKLSIPSWMTRFNLHNFTEREICKCQTALFVCSLSLSLTTFVMVVFGFICSDNISCEYYFVYLVTCSMDFGTSLWTWWCWNICTKKQEVLLPGINVSSVYV